MKKLVLAAVSAIAFAGVASSANAAIVVSAAVADDLHGATLAAHNQIMLDNFDDIDSPLTSYVGNIIEYPDEFQDPISTSAPPPYSGGIIIGGAANPVDNTNYASVQGGTSATYTLLGGATLRGFSFYMGSPDTYNKVTFFHEDGGSTVFEGADIWGGDPPGTGDRTQGFRVYYSFGTTKVTSIRFESSADAFEYDGLAGIVPEPATWALMIGGFGMAGAMIRRRKAALA
ncbi:PEPxxWA-CTERM sorting domain-containing protein [Phenylobacterium sp.]|uniref:Npun_F0296 family exosortase-dependent surface protein n=1 Tax=Phenylobacterium sp. TaxID=1871053 RepID=UPI0025E3945F|nr:PEPxxWA-CTERM sorting domain-containing protein [Phenylobacterium sp.]MBX3485317.1 PEP-CTERM sorting domain-containing protein [Phenylobacterium sp.]MCW5759465.1 PEP-CTERM sorting domain-containing protein [Phenylobacterium sp.]